jgi:hypothetical protein
MLGDRVRYKLYLSNLVASFSTAIIWHNLSISSRSSGSRATCLIRHSRDADGYESVRPELEGTLEQTCELPELINISS